MPGPFPGMDPYLEEEWEDVHHRLIGLIADQLGETLPDDLVCRANKKVVMRTDEPDDGPGRWVTPDDYIAISGSGGWADRGTAAAAVLDATEVYEVAPETYVAKWLEVRDRADREVVTTVEVLSPINKEGEREAFRRKQRELVEGGVSLVEIDLLRRGGWALYPPEDGVPEEVREPYRLCSTAVTGGAARSRFARVRLREPLPAMAVPLRPGEPVVALQLQPLVEHLWVKGRYGRHYDADPPPFPADDAAWVTDRVREWAARGGPAGGRGGGNPEAAAGADAGPTAAAATG